MTGSDRPDEDGPPSASDDVVRTRCDWSSRSPSVAVVEAVARALEEEPGALDPLYESVDPDALDEIVRSTGADGGGGEVTVSVTFAGHHVTVRSSGLVEVRPVP